VTERTGEQTGQEPRQGGLQDGGVAQDRLPRDDEPGGTSTPRDTEGEGSVGLEDRTGSEDQGAPAANQAKAEPIPPTPGHRDPAAPLTPPPLEDMNVGADDPQTPSHPAAAAAAPTTGAETAAPDGPANAPRDVTGPGVPPGATRPTVDGTTRTGADLGPDVPASGTAGRPHRAPGLQGEPSAAEEVDTDLEDSAAGMVRDTGRGSGSGDVHGVPVPSEVPSAGTSEQHGAVEGARIPRSDGR
jgi:hypothetical protein